MASKRPDAIEDRRSPLFAKRHKPTAFGNNYRHEAVRFLIAGPDFNACRHSGQWPEDTLLCTGLENSVSTPVFYNLGYFLSRSFRARNAGVKPGVSFRRH